MDQGRDSLPSVGGAASESSAQPNAPLPTATPSAPEQSRSSRGSRLPEDWLLPKAWGEWALTDQPTWTADKVRLEADKFRDHWHANANQSNGKKADWQAAWRNWVRKEGAVRNGNPASGKQAALENRNQSVIDELLRESGHA